jgi:hypothetical protein
MSAIRTLLCVCMTIALCGCGTRVPDLREWPENDHFGAVDLVRIIVRSVECELKHTVTDVVNTNTNQAHLRANHRNYSAFLNDWGAEVALTFTIVEKSGINPNATWLPAPSAGAIFTLNGNVSLSGQATRIQKMNIFYTMRDLYLPEGKDCDASGEDPSGSFLIRNDLKLRDVLDARILPAVVGIADLPGSGQKNVLSQEISFQAVLSGSLTPTVLLTRASVNTGGSFLSGSRDRTQDLLITFGPLDKAAGGKSLIAIAEQSHFTSQINSGVTTGFKSVLSQ